MAVVLKTRKREVGAATYSRGREGSHLRPSYDAKTPPCQNACPMDNDIRGFLTTIAQGEAGGLDTAAATEQAWRILTETNPIPAVLGRVCPHFCETDCNRQFMSASRAAAAVVVRLCSTRTWTPLESRAWNAHTIPT